MERLLELLPEHLVVESHHEGHKRPKGRGVFCEKNPYVLCHTKDIPAEKFYVIFCEKDTLTFVSVEDISHVLKVEATYFTWYKLPNGYIAAQMCGKTVLLHSYVMEKRSPPQDGFTVTHKNNNKLDNRHINLLWEKSAEVEIRKEKQKRRLDAQPLPDTISDLPRFIIYFKDKDFGENEYFRIEKHPVFEEGFVWTGTKSKDVDIAEKLREAKEQLNFYNEILSQKECKEPVSKIQKKDCLESVRALIDFYREHGKFPSGKSTDKEHKRLWNLLTEIRRFEKKESTTTYVPHRKLLDEARVPWKTK
jgi:hypothetical protein